MTLNPPGIGAHRVGDRRDAEGRDGRQEAIAEHGADARRKPGPEAAGDGALNDEDIHRPDRRRHQHANADPGEHELKGG